MNQGQDEKNRQKRTRRLAMNRVTARERRSRKRNHLEDLVMQADDLKAMNASIEQNNHELSARIKQLSAAAGLFGDAPTTALTRPTPLPLSNMDTSAENLAESFPSNNPRQLLVQQNMMGLRRALPPGMNSNSYDPTRAPSVIHQIQRGTGQQSNLPEASSNRLGGPAISNTLAFRSLLGPLIEQRRQTSQDAAALTGGFYQQHQNVPNPNYVRAPSLCLNPGLASRHLSVERSVANPASNTAELLQHLLRENESHHNQRHSRR